MSSVLIVEDSKVVQKILRHIANQILDFDVFFASSRAEALQHLSERSDWFAAIVDLNLPDAPDGEIVANIIDQGIPTIVLTGSVDDKKRDELMHKGIVDYVFKDGLFSYQYAINLVNRIYRNQSMKVLVAEDSATTRQNIAQLLSRHLYQVIEVDNGKSALEKIQQDSAIKLVITDYDMPVMDGFQLIHELRHKLDKVDIMIIGLASPEDKYLSAKFIKSGANDFLYKPFTTEEFFCRIMQSMDAMERIESVRKMAYTDALTEIGNRRYFFEKAESALKQARENNTPLSLALLDIDKFKSINDTYGHDVGDHILCEFSRVLDAAFSNYILARTGGEEFCIMFPDISVEQAMLELEHVRKQVEQKTVNTSGGEVNYTFSAGLAQSPLESVETLMKSSDTLLYKAKESGRNQIAS
ncbi:response regulator [Oceaniserpentilla sp. 4NH20-0058]|uniref:GGDEF domain-containing response regulator n=1 Tax=Oceaniserpentilla sp. 4NH20-0058 TaxID=3127660 RepID=UPI00310726E3